MTIVDEFAFEQRLCAHLERTREAIIARQLGGGVTTGNRVLDTVIVDPGPTFEERTRLTDAAIPQQVLEADIGPGRFRDWRALLGDGMAAERAVERAHEIGYLEMDHRGGRELVRTIDRYPVDWFDRIIAIENKPDLSSPGDLYKQLRFDASLALVDAVILATESHVTRAHRNRLPKAVGIWRFDPSVENLEVVKEPSWLPVHKPGIEVLDQHPGRIDVEPINPDEKQESRRYLAERAYGKGWRTFTMPTCSNFDPADGIPYCTHFDEVVNPATACNPSCHGHRRGPPPAVDLDAIRDRHSPWVHDPPDVRSRQAHLTESWDASR